MVGVSWTSASAAGEGNLLITTTESRVQIHAADDQRVVASWLTRSGSYNRFTTAAVQHRVWRKLFAVQNGSRLFSWDERESSLEGATKVKLDRDVYALRVSKHIPALAVVYRDGGVSIFNEKLQELYTAPGATDGSVCSWARTTSIPGQGNRVVLMLLTQQPAGSKAAATSLPCLRVYTLNPNSGAAASGAAAAAAAASSSSSSAGAGAGGLSFRHVATQTLPPPADAATASKTPLTLSAVSLHKHAQQLGLFWSDGTMQTLSFPAGATWYAGQPHTVLQRRLARLLPPEQDAASGSGAAAAASKPSAQPFQCAAFALEPSCVVLAAAVPSSDSTATATSSGSTSSSSRSSSKGSKAAASKSRNASGVVGIAVWDVRYGIMLGTKAAAYAGDDGDGGEEEEVGAEQEEEAAVPEQRNAGSGGGARAGKGSNKSKAAPEPAASSASSNGNRDRSDSIGSTGSTGSVGSLLSSAQAVTSAALTPDTVFQVTVSEDGSFVAVASRRRVLLTPVAVHSASLATALGRLLSTQSLLQPAADSSSSSTAGPAQVKLPVGRVEAVVSVAPTLNLTDCLRAAVDAGAAADAAAAAAAAGKDAGAASAALPPAAAAAWSRVVSDASQTLRTDVEAVLSGSSTVASVAAVVSRYGVPCPARLLSTTATATASSSSSGATAAETGGKKSNKRNRATAEETPASSSSAATSAASAVVPRPVPQSLAIAAVQRLVTLLQTAIVDAVPSAAHTEQAQAALSLLSALVRAGAVSACACPSLLPALATAASMAPLPVADRPEARTAQPVAVTTLCVLRDVLVYVTDIPESVLVAVWSRCIDGVAAASLAAFWRRQCHECDTARRLHTADAASATATELPLPLHVNRHVTGLLYLLALCVRAPRNDVFLESALTSLPPHAVKLTLASLLRLLKLHASALFGAAATPVQIAAVPADASDGSGSGSGIGAKGERLKMQHKPYKLGSSSSQHAHKRRKLEEGAEAAAAASSAPVTAPVATPADSPLPLLLPTYGQVVDWLRMLMDAHFTRLILLAKTEAANGTSSGAGSVRQLLLDCSKAVSASMRLCDAVADLRGHTAHILQRQPLPQPPEPEYSVEIMRM